jgi:hypothetical protein
MSKRKSIIHLTGVFLKDCIELNLSEDEFDRVIEPTYDMVIETAEPVDECDDQDESETEQEPELKLAWPSKKINKRNESDDEEEQNEPNEPLELNEPSDIFDNLPDLYKKDAPENEAESSQEFDTILPWFHNPKQWVKSTNLMCWRCGLVCNEHPWFIPLTKAKKLVPAGEEICDDMSDAALLASSKKCQEITVIKPYGVFCRAWCAMARINQENDKRITNKWQSIMLLREVYFMFTGHRVNNIPDAYYPKEIMIQYCGSKDGVTPEQYRQMNDSKALECLSASGAK